MELEAKLPMEPEEVWLGDMEEDGKLYVSSLAENEEDEVAGLSEECGYAPEPPCAMYIAPEERLLDCGATSNRK